MCSLKRRLRNKCGKEYYLPPFLSLYYHLLALQNLGIWYLMTRRKAVKRPGLHRQFSRTVNMKSFISAEIATQRYLRTSVGQTMFPCRKTCQASFAAPLSVTTVPRHFPSINALNVI